MRITLLGAEGLLSFEKFTLQLDDGLTVIVGPNGAGKSNLTRLVNVSLRAIDCADGRGGDAERMLAAFLDARHVGSLSPAVEVRLGFELTEPAERGLVIEFVRAMVAGAFLGNRTVPDTGTLDSWAHREITEDKLRPLMRGQIVTSHLGTEDARWQCMFEFTAPDHDGKDRRYRWNLLGLPGDDALVRTDHDPEMRGTDVITRVTGSPSPSGSFDDLGTFRLLDLLPHPERSVTGLTFDLRASPPESQRHFAYMTGLSLVNSEGYRRVNLASAFRVLLGGALVQTTDMRLLPSGGFGWSAANSNLTQGAEGRVPELLLRLKNGAPADRARYRRVCKLFADFTHGRTCEVRLISGSATQHGPDADTPPDMPAVWVSVGAVSDPDRLLPEVPIEFAGAGAWEALVLSSVLAETAASVVFLDEPAVALHPTLQRQLGAYLQKAAAQLIVITHSSELLPLDPYANVQIVRLDRDEEGATSSWPLSDDCRRRISRKLVAKGNERLPFAWRCVLCEGQDDVEAVTCLADRIDVDLRARNIAVVDCGGRDNQPDYIRFCSDLGIRYLTVMDGDATKAAAKPEVAARVRAVRDAVTSHTAGELVEFPDTLEVTFAVEKQNPSLVPAAVKKMSLEVATAPHEVTQLIGALRRLGERAGAAEAAQPRVPRDVAD